MPCSLPHWPSNQEQTFRNHIDGYRTILQVAKDVTRNNIGIDNVKGLLTKTTFQLFYMLRNVNILKHLIPKFIINIKIERRKPTLTTKFLDIGTRRLAPIGNLLKKNTINNNNTGHYNKNNSSSTTFMRKNMINRRISFLNQNNNNNLHSSTNTGSTNICRTNINNNILPFNNTNQITRMKILVIFKMNFLQKNHLLIKSLILRKWTTTT